MSLFDLYGTDEKKEVEGVEVTFPANEDGSVPTFIIAATSKSNQKYSKALENATKPWRRNIEAMGAENAERIYREVFVKTVLKGWRNVQVPQKIAEHFEGVAEAGDIPFNQKNAIVLFEKLPRLYDDLTQRAGSIELFRDARREEEAGN